MYSISKNNTSIFFISLLLLVFTCSNIYAQDEKTGTDPEEDNFLNYEEPDFLLEEDTLSYVKKKKKKRKKKTFNGLKTKRGFTRKGRGSRETVELFYYLKKYREPNPYVSPIYLFEIRELEIIEVDDYSKKKYPPREFRILHGPYTKKRDTNLVQKGYFYIGTKHHRWETYHKDEIVKLKEKYYKGWPGDSKISYYDARKTKPKEIIPYMFGEKTGTYCYFFENGDLKIKGEYENGIKVGRWEEYWEGTHKRKYLKMYPKNPFEEDREPKVIGEWEQDGSRVGKNVKKRKLGGGR